jgi:hypothetical protein
VTYYAYHFGFCVATVVHLIVGIRLFALSTRNGQSADRILSLAFLLWTLSYLIYGVPWAILGDEELIGPPYLLGSLIALYLANITFTFFTRAVFRSQEQWASWLVAGMVGCLVVGVAGSVWVGDMGSEQPLSNPWWWVARVGSAAPYAWMGAEGFTQYVKARRRRQLGLCPPRVCNRYLLWGLAGGLWLLMDLVEGAEYMVYEATGRWSEPLSVLEGLFEAVPSGMIWLVFFPPVFYLNWIGSTATVAEPSAGDSSHGS